MKKCLFALLVAFLTTVPIVSQIKSPYAFLPSYSKQITPYHQGEAYFNYLGTQSNWIKKQKYGTTNEERDLNVYFISTPENLSNLESIRTSNLASIGLASNSSQSTTNKVIVWISFNVHGNEWAGAESALNVAYELLNLENKSSKEWLKNTIVILDPCINPDGYSRYGNWLREISGKKTHPGHNDREHMEEWPGGRYNHYIFDLNRDWAWQTQVESQQRVALYNQWMPQVHTDVHEMGYDSPYFFPPSAEPLHEFIEPYQKDFHKVLGKNISAKFDAEGWMYNTSERFDLFYPSYGDTYPTYNGAVGMTMEQGGIRAGREILLDNGNSLTIKDRILHHSKSVLTVIESASIQSESLLKGFKGFMTNSRKNRKGKYATYVLKSNPKLIQLADLLKKNGIEYSYADAKQSASGFNYQTKKDNSFSIEPNDMIVKVDQPRAVMTQVLFEPNQKLNDSLSYDITAWALPLVYGVQGYAVKNKVGVATKSAIETISKSIPAKVYGFYIPWNNRISAQVLSALHQNGIKVRSAVKEAIFGAVVVQPGGLIVSKGDNPKVVDFEKTISELIKPKIDYTFISSGLTSNARDLGGENFTLLKAPKILLFSGEGVGSTNFGSEWFYLDDILEYPVSIVDVSQFDSIEMEAFNTILMPDGNYSFSDAQQEKISKWISAGGKVIAINGALNNFSNKESYALKTFANEENKTKAEKDEEDSALKERFLDYGNQERRSISASIPGAIIENVMDQTHPLSFGLGNKYYSLKTDNKRFELLKDASNIAYVPKNFKSYGFVGHEIRKQLEETMSFAIEYKGNGKVIYMVDDPLFRCFWESGIMLYSNALFLN